MVIHEFAHVLDMGNGATDGIPELPSASAAEAWIQGLAREQAVLQARVDRGEPTVLDPYGLEAPPEFFAVAACKGASNSSRPARLKPTADRSSPGPITAPATPTATLASTA